MARKRASLPVVEAPDDFAAICPHCEVELKGLVQQRMNAVYGTAFAWACPSCRRVIGVSHRKGFFMG